LAINMHVVIVREVQLERSSQLEKLARDKWDHRQESVVTSEHCRVVEVHKLL